MKNKLEMGFVLLSLISGSAIMIWYQLYNQAQNAENTWWAGGLVMILANIYLFLFIQRTLKSLNESIRQRDEQTLAFKNESNFAAGLIDTAPVIILLLDAQGMISFVNPFFEQLTGYQLAEIKGRDWFTSFLPKRDHERIQALFLSVIQDLRVRGNINPIVTRNGEEREIEWNSQAIYDADGKVREVISIGKDVTERRLREQEIQRLAEVVRHSSDFIGIFTLEGRAQFLNEAGRQLLGIYEDSHFSTTTLAEYFAETDRQLHLDKIRSVVMESKRWVGEINFCHFQTGKPVAMLLDIFRIDDPVSGQPLNFGIVAGDMSTHKADQEWLRLNEARLNEAQRIAKVGSWELDLLSNELVWTDEIFNLFGINKTKFNTTYESFLDAIHSDDRELVHQTYTRSLTQRTPYEVIHRLRMPDGRIKWVEQCGSSDFDAEGKPLRSRGTVQDITRSYLQANAVLKARTQLQAVIDAATEVSIISTDVHGLISLFNKGAEIMLGYRAEEMVNKQTPLSIHVPAEIAARSEELSKEYGQLVDGMDIFLEPARRGDLRPREFTYIRKDGSQLTVCLAVTAKYNEHGNIIGYLGIASDLTERKRAETALKNLNDDLEQRVELRTAQLVNARDEAERANNAKSEFLSRMSHELLTPLNAVMGFGQLLESDTLHPLNSDQLESVQEILKAGRHLLKLINEVLDLARIESGRINLSLEAVDVLLLIKESITLFQPSITAKQIKLTLDMDYRCAVQADPLRLRQILLNLLSNAVKYNCQNGDIWLGCHRLNKNFVRITLRDSGNGIPAEALPMLFKPFERLESAYTGVEGSGIGLALSKQLIESMGGAIGVESKLGEGSTFWIDCALSDQCNVDADHSAPTQDSVDASLR